MKANKFFLGLALIGAILTGCEKDPVQTGDYDTTSYMSVSIAQVGGTRATDGPGTSGGFIVGEPSENTITSVDFYFFDASGNPFNFGTDVQDGTANSDGTGNLFGENKNCYTYTPGATTDGSNGDNVGKIVNSTLVIKHNKGNIPTSMVAVINCTAGAYKGQSLAVLKTATLNEGAYITSNGHIMTNSVYRGADGKEAFETPISIANLAINETNALANPVTIYVERVAARVKVVQSDPVHTSYDASLGAYDTGVDINIDNAGTVKDVYAKIKGWNIVTYANQGTLVKDVEFTGWDNAAVNGFNWNDPLNYRSYWANAAKTGTEVTKKFKWNQLTNTIGTTIDYCLENTTKPVHNTDGFDELGQATEDLDISRTNVTKVVVAAELIDNTGAEVKFIRWYGQDYSEDGIKNAVAQLLRDKYMYKEVSEFKPIEGGDIDIITYNNVGSSTDDHQHYYQVYFQLSIDGAAKSWYTPKSDLSGMDAVTTDAMNAALKGVGRADYYKGMSYYIVNIKHLGKQERDPLDETVYQPAYYGVVRNHAYEIAIESISGLGTPVIDPDEEHEEPITPTDSESYVAAKINILAWHVVNQTVTLQ